MTSVKETDVVDVAESAGPVDRLHNLLLTMTGRVDDDAIDSAREMLGMGQLDAAAEFLAGCLLAGRIPINSTEQHQLRRILDEARSDGTLADRMQVAESLPPDRHRFSDQEESDDDLIDALGPITGRLGGVRAVWCAWRVTPAGVTYGAVPRRVLLAEIGPDGSITAAGYQLIEALRRAGIGCSVEVFSSGSDLPEYHRKALSSARRVHLDMAPVTANRNGASRARAPRASSGGESRGSNDLPSEPAGSPAEPAPDPVVEERLAETTLVSSPIGVDESETIPDHDAPDHSPFDQRAPGHREAPGPVDTPEPVDVQAPATAPDPIAARDPIAAPDGIPDPGVPDADVGGVSGEHERNPAPVVAEMPGAVEAPFDSEALNDEPDSEATEDEADPGDGSKNMRVPAAVDAKLTDRERNLLRKLHEELAQREQDRGEQGQGEQVGDRHQEAWTAMPGTGGFPPMGAGPAPANSPVENKQP